MLIYILEKHLRISGFESVMTALRLGRIAYEDSYRYVLNREIFSKPLFENQVIRQKFFTILTRLEPTQTYMEKLVFRSLRMPSINFSPLAAMLKVQAAHNLETIS
jgi:alkylation response protein AidB-like acyl-CoA dehydrogenase